MAFTVQDFQDLLRLLDAHPEWQAELRRRLLTDELLELPALVRSLVEAQARTDQQLAVLTARVVTIAEQLAILTARLDTLTARVDMLTERLDALTARVDALTARVDALTERVDALAARVDALTEQMDALTARVDALTARVDALTERVDALAARVDALTEQVSRLTAAVEVLNHRMDVLTTRVDANTGELMELRYERRAPAYFGPLARKIRVLDRSALADMLDEAVESGHLIESERRDALLTDLVLSGQRRADRAEVYLVVEVSVGIGDTDVRRVADRAAVLAKLGRPAIPIVAGERIDPEPAELAHVRGVWQVTDGHVVAPGEAG